MAEFVVSSDERSGFPVGKPIKVYTDGYYKTWGAGRKNFTNVVWFPIHTRKAKRLIRRGLMFRPGVANKDFRRRLLFFLWRAK